MPRTATLTEEEKKERKRQLYNNRKSNDALAEHDASVQKAYLKTIQQIKLSVPNEKAELLSAHCQNLGFKKPQELINVLIDKFLSGEIKL